MALRRLGEPLLSVTTNVTDIRHLPGYWYHVVQGARYPSNSYDIVSPGTLLTDIRLEPGVSYSHIAVRTSASSSTGGIRVAIYEAGQTRWTTGALLLDAGVIPAGEGGQYEIALPTSFNATDSVYTVAVTHTDPAGASARINYSTQTDPLVSSFDTVPWTFTMNAARQGQDPSVDYTAAVPAAAPSVLTLTPVLSSDRLSAVFMKAA